MKEYIEKQAALEAVSAPDIALDNHGYVNNRKAINAIPVADVRENVRGEWIVEEMHEAKYGKVSFRCSACGVPFELEHRLGASVGWNFCPLCGADMRGEA